MFLSKWTEITVLLLSERAVLLLLVLRDGRVRCLDAQRGGTTTQVRERGQRRRLFAALHGHVRMFGRDSGCVPLLLLLPLLTSMCPRAWFGRGVCRVAQRGAGGLGHGRPLVWLLLDSGGARQAKRNEA